MFKFIRKRSLIYLTRTKKSPKEKLSHDKCYLITNQVQRDLAIVLLNLVQDWIELSAKSIHHDRATFMCCSYFR